MKLIRFLVFPFAVVYDLITRVRNFLFDRNVLKSTSFDIPVIAVGNLSVGGTGKTPQIEYLIRLLQQDFKVAVLSRGYKRKTVGFQLVNKTHTAEDVGDEPLQFFSKYEDIHVAVDANRTNGIHQLLTEVKPDVILLDDAYQHRKVKAGFYILLTKYNDLYVNDFLLPTGNLRESRRGAKRADVIVVTKCPNELNENEMKSIKKRLQLLPSQQLYFSKIEYNEHLKGTDSELQLGDLKEEIVLVTGIANPTSLLSYLKDKKIDFTHLKYPDHHHFSEQDIFKIKKEQSKLQSDNKIILTTEKDYVRLKGKLENLYYIEIHNSFLSNQESFDLEVKKFVNK
ncbi:lipid-A-disaccharide kinase [Tenacibaculum skagerrakense]|uniref:Tetraacyldisaccharide 4'-kinase n=1 Tax=Tenacibaculum skagerrakense TaxID=186571 RepID=A0A4R2NXT0_9FLAO|nr:tetraacyldisaccharide 4'-kinase [Tenacibaculum skagerrakense]TCP26867.1 lipid-A-disaccharide kinase [Tenacibaculum skagerrakense]